MVKTVFSEFKRRTVGNLRAELNLKRDEGICKGDELAELDSYLDRMEEVDSLSEFLEIYNVIPGIEPEPEDTLEDLVHIIDELEADRTLKVIDIYEAPLSIESSRNLQA